MTNCPSMLSCRCTNVDVSTAFLCTCAKEDSRWNFKAEVARQVSDVEVWRFNDNVTMPTGCSLSGMQNQPSVCLFVAALQLWNSSLDDSNTICTHQCKAQRAACHNQLVMLQFGRIGGCIARPFTDEVINKGYLVLTHGEILLPSGRALLRTVCDIHNEAARCSTPAPLTSLDAHIRVLFTHKINSWTMGCK